MTQEVIVESKEELKEAQRMGASEIIVLGSLAKSLYAARKVRTMSKASFAMLTGLTALGTAISVPSGGLSLGITSLVVAPLAGMSMETILLIAMLGGAIWSLYNNYDYEFDASKPKLVLRKRR